MAIGPTAVGAGAPGAGGGIPGPTACGSASAAGAAAGSTGTTMTSAPEAQAVSSAAAAIRPHGVRMAIVLPDAPGETARPALGWGAYLPVVTRCQHPPPAPPGGTQPRARATASWMARCTNTLSARSVRTRSRRGPAPSASLRPRQLGQLGGGETVGRRQRHRIDRRAACRRAARSGPRPPPWPGAGTRRSRRRRCRRPRSSGRRRGGRAPSSPLLSCSRAMSPMRRTVGAAEASATPTAVDDDTVDPVGAAVGEMAHTVAWRGVPLHVPHRHRRRRHQRRPVGDGRDQRRGRRPVLSVGPCRQAPRRWPPAPAPRPAASGPPTVSGRRPAAGRPGRGRPCVGIGHDAADGRALGIDPRGRRRHLHLLGARRRQPLGQHLRGGRAPQPEHHRRRVRRRRSRRGAAGRRRRPRWPDEAARQPDRGSASTGQPAAAASACTASGSPAPAPATITPRC